LISDFKEWTIQKKNKVFYNLTLAEIGKNSIIQFCDIYQNLLILSKS